MSIPKDTLDELRAKHGKEIYVLTDDELDVVYKKPSRVEFKRCMEGFLDEDTRAGALDTLARVCVVYPSGDEFGKMLDEWPGIGQKIGGDCLKIARREAVKYAKKVESV